MPYDLRTSNRICMQTKPGCFVHNSGVLARTKKKCTKNSFACLASVYEVFPFVAITTPPKYQAHYVQTNTVRNYNLTND